MPNNFNLEKSVRRIEARLNALYNKQDKETWVSRYVIKDVTGWDAVGFKKAVNNKLVIRRKAIGAGHQYLLESIHPMFLKDEYKNKENTP